MTKLEAVLTIALLVSNYCWLNRAINQRHFNKLKTTILDDMMTTKQRKQYMERLIKETSDE